MKVLLLGSNSIPRGDNTLVLYGIPLKGQVCSFIFGCASQWLRGPTVLPASALDKDLFAVIHAFVTSRFDCCKLCCDAPEDHMETFN